MNDTVLQIFSENELVVEEEKLTIEKIKSLSSSEFQLIKVSNDQVVGRRIFNDPNYYTYDFTGKILPLPPAFEENRPNGISVDILWFSNIMEEKKIKILQNSSRVASLENHSVVGWCTSTAAHIVKNSDVIEIIVKTKNKTNKNHGDLFAFEDLQPAKDAKFKKRNIQIIARLLSQYFSRPECISYSNPYQQINF